MGQGYGKLQIAWQHRCDGTRGAIRRCDDVFRDLDHQTSYEARREQQALEKDPQMIADSRGALESTESRTLAGGKTTVTKGGTIMLPFVMHSHSLKPAQIDSSH